MTMNKEDVLGLVREAGKKDATSLQEQADKLTGTKLNTAVDQIPDFSFAVAKKNMLERKAGFVCRSSEGRVVKLIQPYDSAIYSGEPEELSAQWSFVWSQDPAHARPFVELATSPYQTGDCCTYEGKTWRSGQDGNVWAPGTNGAKWEEVEV